MGVIHRSYMTKPFDLAAVRATVARLTAPRRGEEEQQRWQAEQLAHARPRLAETEQVLQSLTAREREVLALLAAGCTNAEIAEALGISVKTAGNHIGSIFDKLGVRSRTEAAIRAVQAGIRAADRENSL